MSGCMHKSDLRIWNDHAHKLLAWSAFFVRLCVYFKRVRCILIVIYKLQETDVDCMITLSFNFNSGHQNNLSGFSANSLLAWHNICTSVFIK